jgi:pilus assembly protein CpaC
MNQIRHFYTFVSYSVFLCGAIIFSNAHAIEVLSEASKNTQTKTVNDVQNEIQTEIRTESENQSQNETKSSILKISANNIPSELNIAVGETHLLSGLDLKRIAVGNGKVITAKNLDQDQILLLGVRSGQTSLHFWFRNGTEKRVRIRVLHTDSEELAKEVRRWLGKKTNVEVKAVGGKVLIEGTAQNEKEAKKIHELSQRSPLIVNLVQQSGVEQMIAMEVRFLEVKKNAMENIGINWQKSTAGPVFGIAGDFKSNRHYRPASSGTVDSTGALELISNLPGTTTEAAVGRIAPFAMYFGLQATLASAINLMEQQGDAIVLAEPILTCRSGGAAKFLAGGEIPLPTSSAIGSSSVQFKPYGIKFEINPVLTESGTIAARIMTELSTVDPAIKVGDFPAFLSRQTETDVNLREGETLVISGLISEDRSKTIDKLAGLADIPVLGKLFQSKDFRERRSEMVVFVTPRFISPGSELNQKITQRANERLEEVRGRIDGPLKIEGQP